MTAEQAKQVLALYRGQPGEAMDPDIRAALEAAAADAELKRWLDAQLEFHAAVRRKMRQIRAPAHLRNLLLAERQIIRPKIWWQQPVVWAVAAVFVLLATLAAVLWAPRPAAPPDRFAQYQSRMIGTALRQYRMDIVTNDMRQVRQYMAAQGAPADYQLTPGLEKLQLTGGGALKWRNNPVTMVCFDRGDQQMVYLFVTKREALKDPPPEKPQVQAMNELAVVSWSRGDKTYVLAGPAEPRFPEKYL